MSVKNKTSLKSAKVWQRHALAKACVLAIAGASASSVVWADPGAALSLTYGTKTGTAAQTLQDGWSIGYNSQWVNEQVGSADIMAPINSATYFSSLPAGTGGSYPVSIVSNSILSSVLANQGTSSLTSLNRTGPANDGVLSLNLQIFTGLVDVVTPDFMGAVSATARLDNSAFTDGTVYISQQGLDAANLSLSNNSMGASVGFNSMETPVTVATPTGYVSTSKGFSSLSFAATGSTMGVPATPTAGSTASVNLSNLQGAFNAAATAEVVDVMAKIGVSESSTSLNKSIDLNGNSITATTNNNAAVSVFTSTEDSAAFTGTVGVTNSQSIASGLTSSPTQMAKVSGSSVVLDVRNAVAATTQVTGSITVNDNVVSAVTTGNTAGSKLASGSIVAGNAIVFEGSSNFTGANTTRSTDLTANIGATTANAEADLLVNNAQRVSSNNFTASVTTPLITTNLDNLSSNGSLTQNGNKLSASVTNNLAGNLISVGQSASMGSMSGSAVMLNTQQTKTVTTLAEVTDSEITATVGHSGATVDGSASLSSNATTATAQGNLATSTVLLKADNLNVGANGLSKNVALTPSAGSGVGSAVAGLAVSTLNVQSNNLQNLSAINTGGSMALVFEDAGTAVAVSGTQATANSNQFATTATANSASNRTTLQATNAGGMNAAMGNSQTNTNGSTTATSGSTVTPLSIDLTALSTVNGSQLSLSSNSISAQAQLNTVSNYLSSTLTNTNGLSGMLTNTDAPSAIVGNLTTTAAVTGAVKSQADLALGNAQVNTGTSALASTYGAIALGAGIVGATTASTLESSSNRIAATAEGNAASNVMSLNNTNMSEMTAALASGQLMDTTPVTTTTAGTVSVATAAVGATGKASGISVNDNAVSATSLGNVVANILGVTATTAAGRAVNAPVSGDDVSPTKAIASSTTADVKADFALSNSQVLSQTSLINDIASAVSGAVSATIGDDISGGSTVSMTGNSLTASSRGNSASNTLNMAVGQLSQADMAVASMQKASTADIKSLNTATGISLDASLGSINGSQLTVSNNRVDSAVMANTVSNQVTVSSTNVTAPSLVLADKGAAIGAGATVVATSALVNDQTSTQNTMTASVGTDSTSSVIELLAANVNDGSALTMSGNTLASAAYNNLATNGMTLAMTTGAGMTGAIASRQNVSSLAAPSVAATFGGVKLAVETVTGTGTLNPSLTVSSNSISAENLGNSVSNSLAVTAGQWDGRSSDFTVPALTANTSLSTNYAVADLAVANQQNVLGTGKTVAVITANVVGTVENNYADLTEGSITANGNAVSAAATGSEARNVLSVNTSGMSGTTLGVASQQIMDLGKILSTAKTGSTGVGVTGTTTGDVSGGNISVNNNTVLATSAANSVSNSLSATATNVLGTTASVVPTTSFDSTTLTVQADMAVLNNQKTVNSTVNAETGTSSVAARIQQVLGDVTSGANSSNLSLNGNGVASVAYANRAGNSATVAINSMVGMTAGLGNGQKAQGSSLAATTYGVIDSQLASVDASNVTANANAISASALGNNATNSFSVSGSNASGRSVQSSFTRDNSVTEADLVLNNTQVMVDSTVRVITDGRINMVSAGDVSATAPAASNLSLNTNTISAYGASNYASNSMALSSTNLTNATSALMSMQTTDMTLLNSPQVTVAGNVLLQAGGVSDANLAMSSNIVKSTALDNVAGNVLTLVGATATGAAELSMAGLESPIANSVTSSVAADLSLINLQTSAHGGLMDARTGYDASNSADAVDIALSVGGAAGASVTGSDNAVSSLLYANNASNILGMNVTTVSAMTAALSNTQQVNLGALAVSTLGGIRLTSSGAVANSNLTLKDNSVGATAGANDASNAMAVTSTDLIGRALVGREASVGSFLVTSDFALGNEQQLVGGTTVAATSTGDVHLNVATNTIGTSNLTLSGNTLSATGSGNNASNALSMSATNISQASLGLASEQSLDAGTSVTSTTTGSIMMTGGVTTDSALSAANNTIKSTALGNLVTNTLTATASNFTGPTSITVTAAATSGTTSVAADFAIANKQINDSTSDIKAETFGTVQMALGNVTGTTASSSSSSLTGNALKALAQSNSASNELKLNVTQLASATAGVASYQGSDAAVSASVAPDSGSTSGGLFAITSGNVTSGAITVSGNNASALAGINEAFNTLTVTGSNLLGRGRPVTPPTAGTVSSVGADFAVMNSQLTDGTAEASVDAGTSGFISSGRFITGGSVTVSGNALLARASANTANNSLTLNASSRLEASGVVHNLQVMGEHATTKASIASTSVVGAELNTAAGVAVVSVKDNAVTAQATGNVANNALNASASSAMTPAGASGTPSFAVLNSQSTGAAPATGYGVQSVINGITFGSSELGGALNSGSSSVSGNQLQAVAYGNSVNNSVSVGSLTPSLNTASASITNVQYNLTSVNASISNASVQASGTSAGSINAQGASLNISGNSIVAMAVGNRAVNTITGR
jgi:trimeric autotransporter adhesin